MCLLSTAPGGHTCACPDGSGYQLAANQRDCIGLHFVCVLREIDGDSVNIAFDYHLILNITKSIPSNVP